MGPAGLRPSGTDECVRLDMFRYAPHKLAWCRLKRNLPACLHQYAHAYQVATGLDVVQGEVIGEVTAMGSTYLPVGSRVIINPASDCRTPKPICTVLRKQRERIFVTCTSWSAGKRSSLS